ncbi:MAG: hypothetical protein NVSMB16_07360 [Acidimicrobiales bacterium]
MSPVGWMPDKTLTMAPLYGSPAAGSPAIRADIRSVPPRAGIRRWWRRRR